MTALLALVLLGQLPGVALSDHGGAEKLVRHLNCTGSGITCSSSSTFGTINITGGDGGTGLTAPACTAGQVVTSDAGSLSCVSNISTATALAANPTDCSANQYATTIAASGNLTCSQVTTAQLSGTITNAQLASSYSGVGACGSHQWSSTLNANAAPTCTQPAYSDLSGSPIAGGSSPQVQYNNSGVLGGMSNYTSDGTRPIVTAETSVPSSPSAGQSAQLDWSPSTGFPGIPFRVDGSMGGIPAGILEQFTEGVNASNWSYYCANVGGSAIFATRGGVPTAANWSSTGSQQQTADGGVCGQNASSSTCNNLFWRMNWVLSGNTGGTNLQSTLIQPFVAPWRGNTAGAGGFIWWNRIALHISRKQHRYFFGLQNSATGFVNDPNAVTDTVYFGANNGDTNLSICSNDETGTATCSSLGSNFPTQSPDFGTDGGILVDTIYDMWLAAAPNASSISYYISVVNGTNTGANAHGSISSDLPVASVFLRAADELNAADGGAVGAAPSIYFNGMCVAYNY